MVELFMFSFMVADNLTVVHLDKNTLKQPVEGGQSCGRVEWSAYEDLTLISYEPWWW